MDIVVVSSADKMAKFIATLIRNVIAVKEEGEYLSLALSGGNTPKRIFEFLASHDEYSVNWSTIRFFWSDERCVPPDDNESNFRMAKRSLFDKLPVPPENIFRISGEEDPAAEAVRYGGIILRNVPLERNLPEFDIVLLGLGVDGHIASIFPENTGLFRSGNICEVTRHPQTGQQRITLTGRVINNAANVVFMVTGAGKTGIVADVLGDKEHVRFPASLVVPENGTLTWLLDTEAAGRLKSGETPDR